MATRGKIFYYDEDLKIYKGIYCHFDNYLDGTGDILKKHYVDYEKIKKLISLGSIPNIATMIEEIDPYDTSDDIEIIEIETLNKLEIYIDNNKHYVDYYYLYDNNEWYYYNHKNKIENCLIDWKKL